MNEQEWLGSDNQLGLDIWKNKYCDDGETFDHWLERISGGDSEVADLIKEKSFSLAAASWQTADWNAKAKR